MNTEQRQAYSWAKTHDYPSIAARYARALATAVDDLRGQLAESQRQLRAAVEDLKEALYSPLSVDCEYCKYYGAETEEHIAEAGGCHACENHGGFLACFEWRGPQEAQDEN